MDALRPLGAALLALAALSARPTRADVMADTGSKRIPFASREWLDVGLDVNGVLVDRIRLHEPGRIKALFVKHDDTNRGTLVVTNKTDRIVYPALAVAVLDKDGYLLAAANTGTRMRGIKPGETKEMSIHFGGVFRYIERGEYMYVSVEY